VNTADALARILAIEGVQQVFFFPGSPMTEALARAGIRLVLTRQERVAGDMADGLSRSSNGRQIGVFAVQSLAGAENAYAGLAHAWTDSTPTLFLPGHPGLARIGESPAFEALDHFRTITKYRARIGSPGVLGDKMRQAFMALRSGRPGPAMVELPEDVLAEPFEGAIDHRVVRGSRPGPDDGAVDEAVSLLLRAEHPLVWAGQGVLYAEATDALIEVAELLGAPVMTTLQGKSAMPETHPLSAGVGGYAQTPMVMEQLARCDLLLVVGSSLSRTDFTPVVPDGKTIVHATIDPADLDKSYPTDVAITSDARLFLERLAERLQGRVTEAQAARRQQRADELTATRARWLADFEPSFASDSSPIDGYRMFRELWATLDPDGTIITHESGSSRDIQSVFYTSTTPRSYLGWGQSTQLGYSIGAAMGAKIANPDKLVVNVMGDGAIGMTGLDLETAAREEIPILTVVKHDEVFSGYYRHMPLALERYGAARQRGDYAGLARSLGLHAERVEEPGALRAAFERAIAAVTRGQPALVDVITAETHRLSVPDPMAEH
jgi:thiamine pyrophosphate-dependent acetolactate synthase large subunit-like protein